MSVRAKLSPLRRAVFAAAVVLIEVVCVKFSKSVMGGGLAELRFKASGSNLTFGTRV
jgi:hypothetical protein